MISYVKDSLINMKVRVLFMCMQLNNSFVK